jgi:integrase/recombinase XerD
MTAAIAPILKTTVTVYVRHARECSHNGDPHYRGKDCTCPKWLYVYDGTSARRKSAKTRTWSRAEVAAGVERDHLDPVKIRLREIEEGKTREDEERRAAIQANQITIEAALDRWLSSEKDLAEGSFRAYTSMARKVRRWAKRSGFVDLSEITPNILDEWRGAWKKDAADKEDRMGASTQSSFLVRLKAFFKWATAIKLIPENPAANLKRIRPKFAPTQVLTPQQFDLLLTAIVPYVEAQTGEVREFANELRALFLLQRTVGLRLIDCLVLPRTAVTGNRLRTKTMKTGADVKRKLPASVVEALAALSPDRAKFKPEYFLWGLNLQVRILSNRWGKIIAPINPFLQFKDENGQPLRFRSHVLRDTFAVELLLAGFKLEEVSRLLTHESIKTTEVHYAPWIKRRVEQLDAKLEDALSRMGMPFSM